MSHPVPPPRRAMCAVCLRPACTCICRFVRRVPCAVDVLILQHLDEVHHAKGSARLLHLCLPASVLTVGEQFDEAALHGLLHAGGRQPVLLYPGASPAAMVAGAPVRLVLLDATWRKSRKMLHLNPSLQALPRMALADVPPSAYRIRKAHAPHQLSTFEAAMQALSALEPGNVALPRLHDAFADFVDQQAAFVPA